MAGAEEAATYAAAEAVPARAAQCYKGASSVLLRPASSVLLRPRHLESKSLAASMRPHRLCLHSRVYSSIHYCLRVYRVYSEGV